MRDAPLKVLILSAPVGESHTAMANALTASLERRPEFASPVTIDDLALLGSALGRLLADGFELHLGRIGWSYDLAYRLFAKTAAGRRAGEEALYRLGGHALLRRIAEHRPDVVVSTYPVLTPVLGRLRAAARLSCPVVAIVEPAGGLGFWVARHVDLHLLSYPESHAEVVGLGGESACVARPLVREEFFVALDLAQARRAFGLALDRRLALVSGGGWGAGDLTSAVESCLSIPHLDVVVLAGRNERLRAELQRRWSGIPSVRVLGFSKRMRELLSAADVLVTATAGLSCIEARLCGCPVVCYGFSVGHVRDNTRALARFGLARIAATQDELRRELRAALETGRRAAHELAGLPEPAELIAGLAQSMFVGSCALAAQSQGSALSLSSS